MQIDSYQHGEPSWQDHSSADPEKAAEFYSALFGWEVPPGDEQFGGYRNATLNGKMVAGMGPQMGPEGTPAYWSTYINVDDAAEVARKVGEAGGQVIVEPMQIGEFGSMAVFADLTGAMVGVWQPGTHKGAQVRNESGAVFWHELVTTDVEAAGSFYTAVFGWVASSHGPSEGPAGYSEFKLGDKMIGGMMAKPPMLPAEVPSHWTVYFAVDDADAAAERVKELGGQVMFGPMDTPPGRLAICMDPTGASFNVLKSSRG